MILRFGNIMFFFTEFGPVKIRALLTIRATSRGLGLCKLIQDDEHINFQSLFKKSSCYIALCNFLSLGTNLCLGHSISYACIFCL